MSERKLVVVQLLPALNAGGVERSTLEIADALVKAGHRAIVVSAGGRLVAQLLETGAEHVELDVGAKSPLALRHVPALRRIFRDADIVHARSRLPAWLAWLALYGMKGNKPPASKPRFVTTMHGLNSPSRYSAIMARGERVICVSRTVRDYLLQHYPRTDEKKLVVIPRGINAAQFPHNDGKRDARAQAAAQLPQLGGDGPLLLLPGRGTRLKGHADALRLLAALRGDGLDARLWLPGARAPGRDAYLAELGREAARLGIENVVVFSEATPRIAQAYAASDLVLQLSRKPEAFGRTVLEALAIGRPVLGWAHGGVGELLKELQPQGASAPFDFDELQRRAHSLLRAPPALPPAIPYTLQAMQDATLRLYAQLAHTPSP